MEHHQQHHCGSRKPFYIRKVNAMSVIQLQSSEAFEVWFLAKRNHNFKPWGSGEHCLFIFSSHILLSRVIRFKLATFHSQAHTHTPLTLLLPLSPGKFAYCVLPGAVAVSHKQRFNSCFKKETTDRQKVGFTLIYSEIFCIHRVCCYWPLSTPPPQT